jgi:hypothetical protein
MCRGVESECERTTQTKISTTKKSRNDNTKIKFFCCFPKQKIKISKTTKNEFYFKFKKQEEKMKFSFSHVIINK